MSRNSVEQAVILTSRPCGEDNRIVTLFIRTKGITDAMLYGGRKSRMKSTVSPWHAGTVWLYTDEVKHHTKITDFDPVTFRPTLRENLYKNMAAALATELMIVTNVSGEPEKSWVLFNGFLDGLDLSDETGCRTGLLRFLWRYLGLMGLRPDSRSCCRCGGRIPGTAPAKPGGTILYIPAENGFICPACRDAAETGIFLSAESIRYLTAVTGETARVSRNIHLSGQAYDELRQYLFHAVTLAAGGRLKTLVSGIGIL